jgi:hypothetical protein
MRGRTGIAWAIAASASILFLLILACHPAFATDAPAGMSAPPAPTRAFESAPAAQLLQSPFDTHGLALRAQSFSPALIAIDATHDPRHNAQPHPPLYGPLHRRPPPSFS